MNRVDIVFRSFCPGPRSAAENHYILTLSEVSPSYHEQLDALLSAVASLPGTQIFRRFFLSDAANQQETLSEALESLPTCPTSVVEQPPLDGSKIAAWVYTEERTEGCETLNYEQLWTGSMLSPGGDSRFQADTLFRRFGDELAARGMSMAGNCIRTWLFVRDVDTNYAGVVQGRREYFKEIGLVPGTHFIASTGIAGHTGDPAVLLEMDAYSVSGLQDGQVRYLYAADHLSPTAVYGVTFERGTAVTYGDRRHVFISGTASIDRYGQVVHVGDAVAQTGRLLENVGALLSEAGAGFEDVRMAVVYLRDIADYSHVKTEIKKLQPSLQPLFVLAPVCRRAWLVEMECIALTTEGNPAWKPF